MADHVIAAGLLAERADVDHPAARAASERSLISRIRDVGPPPCSRHPSAFS
jgi:hypothetical protein